MQNTLNDSPGEVEQICQCYKKLHLLGVPLYISEENEHYGEHYKMNISPYEGAFSLPGLIKIKPTLRGLPDVEGGELFFVFQEMAKIIPSLADFEMNLLSFWILDIFAEGLLTAQKEGMHYEHQKATLQWIAYFFNYIQKNNPSRKEMFNHLKKILFLPIEYKYGDAAETSSVDNVPESVVGEKRESFPDSNKPSQGSMIKIWNLPLPPDLEESKDNSKEEMSENILLDNASSRGVLDSIEARYSMDFSGEHESTHKTLSETNIRHMKIIIEILYRIFGRLWVFLEIQTAFHSMPPIKTVELPFTLNVPKQVLKKAEAPAAAAKVVKSQKFEALLPKDMESEFQICKNDYILPLQYAEEAKPYLRQLLGISSIDQ